MMRCGMSTACFATVSAGVGGGGGGGVPITTAGDGSMVVDVRPSGGGVRVPGRAGFGDVGQVRGI